MPEKAVPAWSEPLNWKAWTTWIYEEARTVADHFGYAPAIRKRLREHATLCQHIYIVSSVHLAMDLLHDSPALFVIPWDDVLSDGEYDGTQSTTEQLWLVLVVSRKIDDIEYGAASMVEAGMLTTQVLQALQGYSPTPRQHPRMRRVQAPRLGDRDALIAHEKGVTAIPLCFAIPVFSEGAINAS